MEGLILSTKNNFLNSNTKIFFSISTNPSNRGSDFYNKILKNKNCIYLPLKIKNKIFFREIIKFLKKKIINFSGCSISMPFKEEVLKYVDKKHYTVRVSQNANTIILKKKKLTAFNTDYFAAKKLLKKNNSRNIILLGAGALAKTFLSLLNRNHVYLYNKSIKNIIRTKKIFSKIKLINIKKINKLKNFTLINTTPQTGHLKLYNYINFRNARLIIDCVISSRSTYLEKMSKKFSINCINGNNFYLLQRSFQKKIYLNEKL
jgi:shikimate dehydrogenase